MDVRWLDRDEWTNACGGDCDLVGPQHFRDDCIYHLPRTTENARRLRKVREAETFHAQVARCIRFLFRFGGPDVCLVFSNKEVDGYVTGTVDSFLRCFGKTRIWSFSGRMIGSARDL